MFNWLSKIFKPKKKIIKVKIPYWSFVDNGVTLTNHYHIRQLSSVGYKLGGGVDTPTLCGIHQGTYFDVKTPVIEVNLSQACKNCVKEYRLLPNT